MTYHERGKYVARNNIACIFILTGKLLDEPSPQPLNPCVAVRGIRPICQHVPMKFLWVTARMSQQTRQAFTPVIRCINTVRVIGWCTCAGI